MRPAGNIRETVVAIFLLILLAACNTSENSKMDNLSSFYLNEKDTVSKLVIYQVLPRLFGNMDTGRVIYGTIADNGVGKMNDFTDKALDSLKTLGITHIWYTGIIEHATLSDHRKDGIPLDDADVVKGRAGSPYAIKDYYDVDPDLAVNVQDRMKEFEELVQRTHRHGLKVIIDFVPNHVSREYHSDARPPGVKDLGEDDDTSVFFRPDNNFYYLPGQRFKVPKGYIPLGNFPFPTKDGKFYEVPAKATGNNVFKAQPNINDWFETAKLNYGINYQDSNKEYFNPVPSTWKKMRDILLFWAGKDVDGFRCDIAEMVPVSFWQWVIPQIKNKKKDILFIAEIYNPSMYSDFIHKAGFDYLYDKVQLYDTLRHIVEGKGKAGNITTVWRELRGMNGHMIRFLENHDEQRIASPYFAGDPFKALPAMTVTATLYKGPLMIYCGQEVGEPAKGASGFSGDDGRTTLFDYWSMPEFQKWTDHGNFDGKGLNESQLRLRNFYVKLLNLAGKEEAFTEGNFFDLAAWNRTLDSTAVSGNNTYYFLRLSAEQTLLVLVNFNDSLSRDLNFKIPDEISGLPVFHKPAPDERKDLLESDSRLLLIRKENRMTGRVTIGKSQSLIFNL